MTEQFQKHSPHIPKPVLVYYRSLFVPNNARKAVKVYVQFRGVSFIQNHQPQFYWVSYFYIPRVYEQRN